MRAGAVVPAFVRRYALPGQRVLDFGAGPEARKAMRALGLDVTAYDSGENLRPGVHDPGALSRTYDIVLAANVLNTADTEALLLATLDQIAAAVRPSGVTSATDPGGIALLNLPSDPRKRAWTGAARDEHRL